ncbi:hypothetical protein [Lactobacillus amylovorus]|uniref:hypothetical protein n=1 Tax=Lactobacillus amylovorus TaxID=1604 RepID=UPI003F8F45AE
MKMLISLRLWLLVLTATSLTVQLNELDKRNLKKAEELIDRVPDDPTVKVTIRLICHDPSQIVMF